MSHATAALDRLIADPSVNGQHYDIDKSFGGQCWDLVERFAEDLGVPREPWAIPLGPNGWASEAWTDFNGHMAAYFDKIPAGQTQRGDILVYNGHGPYVEGHICIDNGGGRVFEENADPDGSPAHIASRASTYLLGGLRFKEQGEDMGQIEDLTRLAEDRLAETKKIAAAVSVNYHDANDTPQVLANIAAEQKRIDELTKAVGDLQNKAPEGATVLRPGVYKVN